MEQRFTPRMRYLANGLYLVESTSQPGMGHKVDTVRGRCGCTAGRYGKRCHHLFLARQAEAWRQAPASAPAISRPVGMAALQEAFV